MPLMIFALLLYVCLRDATVVISTMTLTYQPAVMTYDGYANGAIHSPDTSPHDACFSVFVLYRDSRDCGQPHFKPNTHLHDACHSPP